MVTGELALFRGRIGILVFRFEGYPHFIESDVTGVMSYFNVYRCMFATEQGIGGSVPFASSGSTSLLPFRHDLKLELVESG